MIDHHPEVGDPFTWSPTAFSVYSSTVGTLLGAASVLHGVVVQVNEAHRWARAAYETPQGTRFECFKF